VVARTLRRTESDAVTRSTRFFTTLLALGGTLVGRSSSAQVASPLQVDQSEYHAACAKGKGAACRYTFTLVARYENQTGRPLYLSYCPPRYRTPRYRIPAIGDTTQDSGYDRAWFCVGHDDPIVMAPGTTRVDTLRVEGPNVLDGHTNAPQGMLDGEFRLVYEVGTCHDEGVVRCLLPLEERSSGVFRVVRPR